MGRHRTKILQYITNKQEERAKRRAEILEGLLTLERIPSNGEWQYEKLVKKISFIPVRDGIEEIRYKGKVIWRGPV